MRLAIRVLVVAIGTALLIAGCASPTRPYKVARTLREGRDD